MRQLLVIAGLFCVGCGPSSPYDYVKVSGTVRYEDGTPIPTNGIRLQFSAQDAPSVEGAHPRPAVANVDADGKFDSVTSYKYGDGLIPGRHKVAIQQATGQKDQLLVPKPYTSIATTPLVVNTVDAPFNIKVPKPKTAR